MTNSVFDGRVCNFNSSMTPYILLNCRDSIEQCCYFWTWCYSGTACTLFLKMISLLVQFSMWRCTILYLVEREQWFELYQVIATAVSTSLVDKTGRRILLIVSLYKDNDNFFLKVIVTDSSLIFYCLLQVSSSGMTISLLIVAGAFFAKVVLSRKLQT